MFIYFIIRKQFNISRSYICFVFFQPLNYMTLMMIRYVQLFHLFSQLLLDVVLFELLILLVF